MRPAIHDGLVLYAPLSHPERVAAGMSMVNSNGKRPKRDHDPLKRESKLAAFLVLALLMGAIGGGLWL